MDTNMDLRTWTRAWIYYGRKKIWRQIRKNIHSAENRTEIQIEIAVSAVIFLQWVGTGICIEIVHRNFRDPK